MPASKSIDIEIGKLSKIVDDDLPAFNALACDHNVPAVLPPARPSESP